MKKKKYTVKTDHGVVLRTSECEEAWRSAIKLHDEGAPNVVLLIRGAEAVVFCSTGTTPPSEPSPTEGPSDTIEERGRRTLLCSTTPEIARK